MGLSRRGFGEDRIRTIEKALRLLTRSSLNTTQAVERIREELEQNDDVGRLLAFVEDSERGVIKSERRGRRGSGD